MEYLKKDEIIFAQKSRPDYSGIPEKEENYAASTQHVFRAVTPHNEMIYDLHNAAYKKNQDILEKMETEAQKAGKTIIWYCCEFVRGILEGSINQGIRPDDFGGSFVPSFAGEENHSKWRKDQGISQPDNHQYSGYTCKGNGMNIFNDKHVSKFKSDIQWHMDRLENDKIRLYYLESLMKDIQNSKKLQGIGERDKYSREIQPLNLWLENEADLIRANLSTVDAPFRPLNPLINIDISKLVTETLKNYPFCSHLQREFETHLQKHYNALHSNLEIANRIGTLNKERDKYEIILESLKRTLSNLSEPGFNVFHRPKEEVKAETEMEIHFYQVVVNWFEKNFGRQGEKAADVPKARKQAKSEQKKILPELEAVLRYPDRLPTLWIYLTRQQERAKGETYFFNESGYIGSNERNAAPLMGLAVGLRQSSQLKPDYTETDVYKILCRRFNVEPTDEPHKAKKAAKFQDVLNWVNNYFDGT